MQRSGETPMWKWHVMKAIVLVLVCLAAYVVFINPTHRKADGPALTREQLDSQSETITDLLQTNSEPVIVVKRPDTNAPLAAASSPIEENPTQPETTNVISVLEPLTTETNLIELVQPVEELPRQLLHRLHQFDKVRLSCERFQNGDHIGCLRLSWIFFDRGRCGRQRSVGIRPLHYDDRFRVGLQKIRDGFALAVELFPR